MRFKLKHPTTPMRSATYGLDAGMGGYFVEVRENRKILKCYDPITQGYDAKHPLQGALEFLAGFEFFGEDDIFLANLALQYQLPEEIEKPELRLAAKVIVNFKTASD
jgi:hypothetical protein